ncbi:MAG: hypothetical protein KKA42_12070 [candidate division Zixibacteria bacterium]|nr:hypothetical protein [candidate division Zixibacteria bacterium]
MLKTTACNLLLLLVMVAGLSVPAVAESAIGVTTGVDLYNRYVWRGLDIANTPSIQPAISVDYSGFELGGWGAYTMSNEASESDEIDFWLGYGREMESGVSFFAMITDYYYPNAGVDMFNFNNHDAVRVDADSTIPDPGAHILEAGLSISGPTSFPVTVSGYVNFYNDAGSNTYFQLNYPVVVNETDLDFFCGAAGGSKDNPDYYGTEDFAIINVGVTATREINMSSSFSLPLTLSFVVNPEAEISHLLVGISF